MAIQGFELRHGAVLVKIVRKSRNLTLFERGGDTAWAAYLVNDAVCLYVKTSDQRGSDKNGAARYSYTFQPTEATFIRKQIGSRGEGGVLAALVCGEEEIALVTAAQLSQCIDLSARQAQNLTVLIQPRRSLRVYGSLNGQAQALVVARNCIDTCEISG